jgi:hypothetical protein
MYMSGILEPPITQTLSINSYVYKLSDLIPHTSVQYHIYCYNDDTLVKSIVGLLDGDQYKEWVDDDYLDNFIRSKVVQSM